MHIRRIDIEGPQRVSTNSMEGPLVLVLALGLALLVGILIDSAIGAPAAPEDAVPLMQAD